MKEWLQVCVFGVKVVFLHSGGVVSCCQRLWIADKPHVLKSEPWISAQRMYLLSFSRVHESCSMHAPRGAENKSRLESKLYCGDTIISHVSRCGCCAVTSVSLAIRPWNTKKRLRWKGLVTQQIQPSHLQDNRLHSADCSTTINTEGAALGGGGGELKPTSWTQWGKKKTTTEKSSEKLFKNGWGCVQIFRATQTELQCNLKYQHLNHYHNMSLHRHETKRDESRRPMAVHTHTHTTWSCF